MKGCILFAEKFEVSLRKSCQASRCRLLEYSSLMNLVVHGTRIPFTLDPSAFQLGPRQPLAIFHPPPFSFEKNRIPPLFEFRPRFTQRLRPIYFVKAPYVKSLRCIIHRAALFQRIHVFAVIPQLNTTRYSKSSILAILGHVRNFQQQ